jgi:hypothetical protein
MNKNKKISNDKKERTVEVYETKITRLDSRTLAKGTLFISTAFSIIFVLATAVGWEVINFLGVWDKINTTVSSIVGSETAFSITKYFSLKNSLLIVALFSVVNVITLTFLSFLLAVIFNSGSRFFSGVIIDQEVKTVVEEPSTFVDSPVKIQPEEDREVDLAGGSPTELDIPLIQS